jgi:hypothetical protein
MLGAVNHIKQWATDRRSLRRRPPSSPAHELFRHGVEPADDERWAVVGLDDLDLCAVSLVRHLAPASSERVPGWATVVSIAIPGGHSRVARPGLRDLAVVNAAVSGDRGPPNRCSLAECGPGSLAGAHCWDLLVAVLRDPADDQPEEYRQRHPRRDDCGGPVSDVHTDVYPSLAPP